MPAGNRVNTAPDRSPAADLSVSAISLHSPDAETRAIQHEMYVTAIGRRRETCLPALAVKRLPAAVGCHHQMSVMPLLRWCKPAGRERPPACHRPRPGCYLLRGRRRSVIDAIKIFPGALAGILARRSRRRRNLSNR